MIAVDESKEQTMRIVEYQQAIAAGDYQKERGEKDHRIYSKSGATT